jgi:hypothetical protein
MVGVERRLGPRVPHAARREQTCHSTPSLTERPMVGSALEEIHTHQLMWL